MDSEKRTFTVAIYFTDIEADSAQEAADYVTTIVRGCGTGDLAVRVYEGGEDPTPDQLIDVLDA